MNAAEAAKETLKLFEEMKRLGGPEPSAALLAYLKTQSTKSTQRKKSPAARARSAVAGGKRRVAGMSETIQELATRLQRNFESDAGFENLLIEAEASKLTRDNVVELYNKLFQTSRNFPKSVTKPGLFRTIRQDRMKRVRDRH